jgi:predicted DNA-binding transcriptional regulator YafY
MIGLLRRSAATKLPIEMIYISEKGVISQRVITIKSMTDSLIRAYCHSRKKQRVFKIDNILSAAAAKQNKFIS